ncbi:MAG: NCS2 family permease [Planctomycetaceae bacterium]|jgi:AGZA family xanthine/uracil permease-like MFS transporter|nr:NCS2 family permease [Planctomycetaceae bacterium]
MDSFFKISQRQSSIAREMLAGVVTFMAMAYIVCVQPQIMSGTLSGNPTGMDTAALITTTCLAAAFGSILMGLWANYPIGLAPGMGENFFVVMTIMPLCAVALGPDSKTQPWQLALGTVFVTGVLFAVLTFFNVRKYLIDVISPNLRYAMAGGIGLLIAFFGLKNAGVVICENNNLTLGMLIDSGPVVFIVGLIAAASFHSLKIRGAILYGIFASAICALFLGKIDLVQPLGLPANPMPVVGKIDLPGVFVHITALFPLILILLFMQVFDTIGTAVGIGTQAGLIEDGKFPQVEKVFAADAAATLAGAVGGHSTVTAYIESVAGVECGGRTGLTAIAAGICFIAALFCSPFIAVVGNYPPITAAALVSVGALMMQCITKMTWDDASEAIPAFLILIGIPMTNSIADGVMFGLIVYPLIKLFSGKGHSISWIMYVLCAVLLLYMLLKRFV